MAIDKDELVLFWEWCGLKVECEPRTLASGLQLSRTWWTPRGDLIFTPPIDLNNLFRYVKPKLDGYMMFTGEGGIHFIASKDSLNYEAVAEKEEDAIFEACYSALVKEAR